MSGTATPAEHGREMSNKMSLLNTLKIDAEVPANFGGNGTQYRRANKALSGEEGMKATYKELMPFVAATREAVTTGKRTDAVSQSAMCTTAIAHGLTPDLDTLKKACDRFDKSHLRYMRKAFGVQFGYVAKATKELLNALKAQGHVGATTGLCKVGAPVFFIDDVYAIIKEPKAAAPSPATGKGKGKGKSSK